MTTTGKLVNAFVALLLSAVPLLAAPSRLNAVVFRVDPAVTLPGLPVAFLVTLPEVVVERGLDHVDAVLHVVSPEGERFEAMFDADSTPDGSVEVSEATVRGRLDFSLRKAASAGTVEVQESISPPRGPAWFADHRLQNPGTYRLRLQILTKELGMSEDLWSSEAILLVREPKGADAEAWQWLRDHANGWKWAERSDVDVARKLIDAYPSSLYAMYAVGSFDGYKGDFTNWLDEAARLSKDTWLGDYYRLRLEGMRAGSGSPCMSASFVGSRSDRSACRLRVAAERSEHLRSTVSQIASPSVRHLADVEEWRLRQQIDDLKSAAKQQDGVH